MKFTFHMVKEDFTAVMTFSKRFRIVMIIYFVFNGVMLIMASAVDSLEVAFIDDS